jgi:hypothetical protein
MNRILRLAFLCLWTKRRCPDGHTRRTIRLPYSQLLIWALLPFGIRPAVAETGPQNWAPQAHVSASSHFSDAYRPEMAINGVIPLGLQQDSDWAVRNTTSGHFTLEWDHPIEAAQIVYYARVTSPLLECFKDYQVWLDDADTPVVTGSLEHRRGPQSIRFPRQKISKLRLEFLNAHPDSPNPGAAEIAVFSQAFSDEQLAEMQKPPEEKTPAAKELRRAYLGGELGFRDILVVKRKPLDISHVYVYHVEGYRPGGGLYVYSPTPDGGELKCIFDAGEGMITTADLSYDGREVVFAWRRGGHVASNPVAHIEDISRYDDEANNYHIFKINIDGTGLTQLTHGAYNNLDPCWLPDGGIAFISDRKPAYAYCYVVTSPVLYRMLGDGSQQQRLSANYLMDFTPSVLNDGRIIYTRWEYVDRAACPIQSLWAINPDGTGLTGFYGNRVISPGTFMDAQPIPGTDRVIATATNHNGPCRGAIVEIDPARGANAKEAVRNLTPEVDLYAHRLGAGPWGNGMLDCGIRGMYEKPFAVDANRFLVSKGGTIQLRDFEGNATALLEADTAMGYYCPMPIQPTEPPPQMTGSSFDHTVKMPADGSVTGSWAAVFVQDVYNGLEPEISRGEISQIAVVQEIEKSTHSPQNNVRPDGEGFRNIAVFGFQFPLVSCGATYAPKKVWGFADVNADGSAAFQVPSEVPVYFLALDNEGRALQRMRSFTHFMPGEVQGCVGCHADRNMATPRLRPRPNSQTEVQALQAPAWGVQGFSYREVVQPVFDEHCIACHHALEPAGNIDLTGDMTDFFNVSYDELCRPGTQGEWNWHLHGSPSGPDFDEVRGMSPYVEWIWTINGAGHNVLDIAPRRWGSPASALAELIRTGHPDETGAPRVDVPDSARRRVYLWLDLNIPYYGTSSSNHKTRLGSRRMLPSDLEPILSEVASRRCVHCHDKGIPRTFYTRVEHPEHNNFLLAPLASAAGGTEKCSQIVFHSQNDPDYQKILQTFQPIHELLKQRPRADMSEFQLICE